MTLALARKFNSLLPALVLAGFVFCSLGPGSAWAAAEVGHVVAEFSLEKKGGGTFAYPEEARGKVVFLNFWASWCPECKAELPELGKMNKKLQDQPFLFLAVNIDKKRKAADRFLKKAGLDLRVLYDTERKVVNAFGPVGMPASYLIDAEGKIQKVYLGFKHEYLEKYAEDIDALLQAPPQRRSPTP